MFVLELRADDVHAAMGRLLDQVRLAGIPLAAVEAIAGGGGYTVRAVLKTEDAEGIDRLARRAGNIVGVTNPRVARDLAPAPSFLAVGAV